jgi:flagellar hook-associated protein 2
MSSSVSSTSSVTSSGTSSSTTTASASSPLFQAGGLASGINTSSIVDALIAAESAPLNRIKQRQADYNVQISTIGTLVTQMQALQTSADNLAKNGVASIQPTSTFSDFTVSGSAKSEATYTINVQQVAKAAKMQLSPLTSAQDASLVADGNLQFSIDGKNTAVIDTTGKTLADVAEAINQNISGLSASVISTTSGYVLNISRTDTGYTTTPSGALTIVSDPGLGTWTTQDAQNARVSIDGLTIERTSNTISDAVPGATLRLTAASKIDNTVTFAANSSGTETALNGFIDAYNTLAATVRSQLVTDPTVAYGDTLLNHSMMTSIESSMQRLTSQLVVPTGSVRTLADLGLELQQDGTITLNAFALDNALNTNAAAANAIFSTATNGIAAVIDGIAKAQTNSLSGALTQQKDSLQSSISEMDDQAASQQSFLDAERTRLVNRFTAMEQLVSGFNSATTYLTQIANLKISG